MVHSFSCLSNGRRQRSGSSASATISHLTFRAPRLRQRPAEFSPGGLGLGNREKSRGDWTEWATDGPWVWRPGKGRKTRMEQWMEHLFWGHLNHVFKRGSRRRSLSPPKGGFRNHLNIFIQQCTQSTGFVGFWTILYLDVGQGLWSAASGGQQKVLC